MNMSRKIFLYGFTAGIFSAVASLIYKRIHYFATYADFSRVLNNTTIVAINLLACMLIATSYWIFRRWLKAKAEIPFNFTLTILSFASIIIPISVTLPLDIQYPELFPGLAVPMHFFPALAWYTLKPVFIKKGTYSRQTEPV
jgi:cbb3-type cytochrome oxidase subunit 1